jgi:hypothetical protein
VAVDADPLSSHVSILSDQAVIVCTIKVRSTRDHDRASIVRRQTVSVQTMTAAKFGGVTRNGITFVAFEDGDTWCTLGHVDPAGMAEAVNEWFRETAGSPSEPETFDADVVEHLWAIEVEPPHPVSDGEWWLTWRDAKDAPVTRETPGSFAISLIRV